MSCTSVLRMTGSLLFNGDDMPELGEIRYGQEIGKTHSLRYVWYACIDCQKERWVVLRHVKGKPKPDSLRCHKCAVAGVLSGVWKGGRWKSSDGYVNVRIYQDDPLYSMADQYGYIFEHRLVMARHLNRCLFSKEVVHHKNGVRDDNRLENFELMFRGKHMTEHSKGYCEGYEQGYSDGQNLKIEELKKEIRILRLQINEFTVKSLMTGLV